MYSLTKATCMYSLTKATCMYSLTKATCIFSNTHVLNSICNGNTSLDAHKPIIRTRICTISLLIVQILVLLLVFWGHKSQLRSRRFIHPRQQATEFISLPSMKARCHSNCLKTRARAFILLPSIKPQCTLPNQERSHTRYFASVNEVQEATARNLHFY